MRQSRPGQKVGSQCIGGRIHEGARRAKSHQDHKNGPHVPEVGKRENQQAKCAGNFNKQAQGYDQPAIELVGNEPRDQHEQQRRQKLRQAHKAKIKRIAGEIINLPAHRHRHDLHGKTGGAQGRQIKYVRSVMKGIGRCHCRRVESSHGATGATTQ